MKKDVENFKSDIMQRVERYTNDVRTFLYFRYLNQEKFEDKSLRIGGGNFLIALANFCALDFLSKVFFGLNHPSDTWPKKNKKDPFRAKEAFIYLIRFPKFPVKFGFENLSNSQLETLWDEWRNCLSHFLGQKENNSAISYLTTPGNGEKQYGLFIKRIPAPNKPFQEKAEGSGWDCYVDNLSLLVEDTAKYVSEFVENSKEINIKAVMKWHSLNTGSVWKE